MNEESFIISIKRDPNLQHLMNDNKALMAYAKRVAPWLNLETVARYRREYRHRNTPTQDKWQNKIVNFNFETCPTKNSKPISGVPSLGI